MIHTEFESRASFKEPNREALSKFTRKSIASFFKHCEPPISLVKLTAFRAGPGGDPHNLIKVTHDHPNFGHAPVGIPVVVYTEGTQGVTALLEIPGKSTTEVASILTKGPYIRKKKVTTTKGDGEAPSVSLDTVGSVSDRTSSNGEVEDEQSTTTQLPTATTETAVNEPLKENVTSGDSSHGSALQLSKGIPPQQKLEELGFPQEDIERLKETLASIVVRVHGSSIDVPNILRAPVKAITEAILEHMKLPFSSAGNYQGRIGSFYASKIALFALKYDYEDKSDLDQRYQDWLFDCLLVVDFIGGSDQLSILTRRRDEEVEARRIEESLPKAPAPTADEVKDVVLGDATKDAFSKDAEILKIAAGSVIGRQKALEDLCQAKANEEAVQAEVTRLRSLLQAAEEEFSKASSFREDAEREVAKFTLTEEIRSAVRAAKARFDKLMKDLGMS